MKKKKKERWGLGADVMKLEFQSPKNLVIV